jgi:hypothetical protein
MNDDDRLRIAEAQWRWRWDLNPRRGCPLTRFRGLRWAIHHRSRVYLTWADRCPAFAGEGLRTGVNETETETGPGCGTWLAGRLAGGRW